jgi:N-acyl-D-amino-acid deacylase
MNIIGFEEAIRRMTSLPAQKFGLKERGLLREGFAADVVIFNPETIIDKSVFDNPHQFAAGIPYVIVNGKVVIEDGTHNGTRSGKALRKKDD